MSYQGLKVRGSAFALVALGAVLGLAGCQSTGEVKDDGGGGAPRPLLNSSFARFTISQDPTDASLLVVEPAYGDAWLDAEPVDPAEGENRNKIVWTFDKSFDIRFVQIDDPGKNPTRKLGPSQQNGWNKVECKSGPPCVFELPLYKGNNRARKEIRGVKYLLRSPSGCTTGCAHLDPVLIVRY